MAQDARRTGGKNDMSMTSAEAALPSGDTAATGQPPQALISLITDFVLTATAAAFLRQPLKSTTLSRIAATTSCSGM